MASDPTGSALTRRGFLRLGFAGAATLTVLGGALPLAGCGGKAAAPADGLRFLTDADAALFRALLPAVAGPAWPTDAAAAAQLDAALKHIDFNCHRMGPPAQKELRKLFDLLAFAPFRRFAAGVRGEWAHVSRDDAAAFLERWRASSVELFNGAYRVLEKFCAAAFWGHPANAAAAGYPGPQAFAMQALA